MAETYQLVHWVIKEHPSEPKATVHLHGERKKFLGGVDKHIDYVTVGLIEGETDPEIIRCAVASSPNQWKMTFGKNVSYFGGHFSYPLDARLMDTLTDPSKVSSSNSR